MANFQQFLSFFLVLLATITILFSNNSRAEQADLVELCAHTDYPSLCSSVVKSVQGGAPHVTKAAVQATILQTTQAKTTINKLIESGKGTEKANLKVCLDVYDDAITNLITSLKNLNDNSLPDLKINLSAAITDFETCNDSFTENPGEVSPIANINTLLSQLASNSLALACELKI